MCDRISFQPVPKTVKTAEELYKEWWEKNQHDAGTETNESNL
jgi:hypothetical protein